MSVIIPSQIPPPPRPPPTTRYSWRDIHPQANLHYIRNLDQANAQLELLEGPVGFDLEWRPSFRKGEPEHPTSLVQLANSTTILLIQVSAMEAFPSKLQEFLENPDFVKAGVAIQGDVKKLYKDFGVSVCNCVDLSLLARSVDNARWKGKYSNPLGLARLVDVYEDLLLPKGKISRSNWAAELTIEQQDYAGNDAHSGYIVYEKLIAMSNLMTTVPKSVYYTFDAVRGRLCEPSGMHWSAFNPDYDPGPPPPPKIPKPPRTQDPVPSDAQLTPPSGSSNKAPKYRKFSSQAGSNREFHQPMGFSNSRPRVTHSPSWGASSSKIGSSPLTDIPRVAHPSDSSELMRLDQPPKYAPRPRKRRRTPNTAPDKDTVD